nr:hypothetical protein B0A51_00132 [Rachicladosporium sp. CCFEE 5018]
MEQLPLFASSLEVPPLIIAVDMPDESSTLIPPPNASIPMIHMKDLKASAAPDAPPGCPRVVKLDTFRGFVDSMDPIAQLSSPVFSAVLGDNTDMIVQCCRFEYCAHAAPSEARQHSQYRHIPERVKASCTKMICQIRCASAIRRIDGRVGLDVISKTSIALSDKAKPLFPDGWERQVWVCGWDCPEDGCRFDSILDAGKE